MELWLDDGNPDPALCSLQPESMVRASVIGLWCISYSFRLVLLARSWLYMKWELLLSQTLTEIFTNTSCTNSREVSIPWQVWLGSKGGCGDWVILEDTSQDKESSKFQSLVDTYGNMKRTNSILKGEIIFLIKELNEERSRRSRQEEMMAEVTRIMWSLT